MTLEILVCDMTAIEARHCVTEIVSNVNRARTLLLELYERKGWQVLGYSNWRECVTKEFGQSKSHLYRQLEAAKIERIISPIGEISNIPEGQLRPLTKLPTDQQAAAWTEALETAPPGGLTAAHVQQTVDKQTGRSVTYKNQPGIEATHGNVPLAGTSHAYTVKKLLWPEAVEDLLRAALVGTTLHLCHGKSTLGNIRLDLFEPATDVRADASRLPFQDLSVDTILVDPPYNGQMQWNHDLLSEMARVARQRIVFQHWFIPANKHGLYKKSHRFSLFDIYVWQPKTYFGRAQLISIFEAR